jgi:hypothetical protein
VQDNIQQGLVDVNFAVIFDEAQLLEFVHEEVDTRPRCANHLRQFLLRYLGKCRLACEFEDAEGCRHTLVDKVPIFTIEMLNANSA